MTSEEKTSIIEYDFEKSLGKLNVNKIIIYPHTSKLYNDLAINGFIERLKSIKQLGILTVKSPDYKCNKYDYILLQCLLINTAKNSAKISFEKSYGSTIAIDSTLPKITIADAMQILALTLNCGQIRNTFDGFRGIVEATNKNAEWKNYLSTICENDKDRRILTDLLNESNYRSFSQFSSLMVLNSLDKTDSCKIAKELIHLYCLKEDREKHEHSEDVEFVINQYKKLRDLAFTILDLSKAPIPLFFDLSSTKSLERLLKEYLSSNNNRQPTEDLLASLKYLLDRSVYHPSIETLACRNVYKTIATKLNRMPIGANLDFVTDLVCNKQSPLNQTMPKNYDFNRKNILKLTFESSESIFVDNFCYAISRIDFLRIARYIRPTSEISILISISEKCPHEIETSFKVIQNLVKHFGDYFLKRRFDDKLILTIKFFLYYWTQNRTVELTQAVGNKKGNCVALTKGLHSANAAFAEILSEGESNGNFKHEVEFLRDILHDKAQRKTCLIIPCSIKIYDEYKGRKKTEFHELDGMAIFPNQKQDNLIIIEAKNRKKRASKAKQQLLNTLEGLGHEIKESNVRQSGRDAYAVLTL